jgi:hypothetical protein
MIIQDGECTNTFNAFLKLFSKYILDAISEKNIVK